jgi:hypothetical protein
VLTQIFDVIDNDKQNIDVPRMKQLGFYSLATINQIDPWNPAATVKPNSPELLDSILGRVSGVINEDRDFLTRQTDLYNDLLSSDTLSSLMRTAYDKTQPEAKLRIKDFLNNLMTDKTGRPEFNRVHNAVQILKAVYDQPGPKAAWKNFVQQSKDVKNSEQFKQLRFKEAFQPILRFVEERDGEQLALSKKLRLYLAQRLDDKDLDQFLSLAQTHPNEFYHLLETISQYAGKADEGKLKDFLRMVRRSLGEPAH